MEDHLSETPIRERTVAAVLDRQVGRWPHKVAVVDENDHRLTYAELQTAAFRVAQALTRSGVGRQEPVVVMLDNHLDNVQLWLGISVAAMVHVPVNTAFKGEMLRHVIENAGARVVIIEGKWCDRLARIVDDLPTLEVVFVRGTPAQDLPSRVEQRDLNEIFDGDPVRPDPPEVWDVASIVFTSGTEGASKGVLVPHGQPFATASFPLTITPDDVMLVSLPLFHAAGLWHGIYGALRDGATAVIHTSFSVSTYWDMVRQFGCTKTFMLGSMADFLWRQPPTQDDRSNPLKSVLIIPASPFVTAFGERFGFDVYTSYGLTEAGTVCTPGAMDARPFVLGYPRPHAEMKIVDSDDIEMADGDVGEIVVRSRDPWTMMLGYNKMPEATTVGWRNLWLHTGDAGYRDTEGCFFYVDRKKDSLRRRGENVSSSEVERHIEVREDVAEVAVVAVASEHTEDEIKAVIVLSAGCSFDGVSLKGSG